jgi:glutaredoxin 3
MSKMQHKTITIYTSSTCADCQSAKEFLIEKGIEFEEKGIEDPKSREELMEKYKRMAVPTIIINDEVILGFSQNMGRIKKLLDIK